MQSVSFGDLGLAPELLQAVAQMGFEQASPIQAAAIPILLSGKDVAGLSRTGSGKTAAFAIPAVQLVDSKLRAPQVLILCPTRELATQISGEVAKLSAFKRGIRELAIYGGQAYGPQYRGLEDGAQIIAGTPGRIMDHLERGSLKLDQIRLVVLDEADRMLDMGFREDIATILDQAPPERQTAFFSATMPSQVEQLIHHHTRDPQWVRLETRAAAAPDIDQSFYEVAHGSRIGALCRVLEATSLRFGIVFCSTKSAVDGVTEHLIAEGFQADRLHGDMSQAMRERVMRRFREGKLEFLVATDVAARGIDVDDVQAVINYDIPRDPEDYVHRIGRTGRAGRSGRAITFITSREFYALDRIQRLTRVKIRRERMPTAGEAIHRKLEELVKVALALTHERFSHSHKELATQLIAQSTPETAVEALLYLLGDRKAAFAKARQGTLPAQTSVNAPSESPAADEASALSPATSNRSSRAPRSQSLEGDAPPRSERPRRDFPPRSSRENAEDPRSRYPRKESKYSSRDKGAYPARRPDRSPSPHGTEAPEGAPFPRSQKQKPHNTPWAPRGAARLHPKTGAPRPPRKSANLPPA